MFAKKSISRVSSILLAVLLLNGTASASPLNAALGTGARITYQGKLTDGGAPANGDYDFEFKLYNAISGGSQVGSSLPQSSIAVADGLFTVQLDFGNVFDGTALFLSIGVKPGESSAGAYTTLTPRQALTAPAVGEEGLRCRAEGPNGATLVSDMPKGIGGGGAAPSPGWLLRAALASCDATVIALRREAA